MNLQEFARETDNKLRSYERLYYDEKKDAKRKVESSFL